ncbi:hypothetical protein D0Z06_07205 [Geodermatophilus marinus]|nr:hypothetical protein D0Z06_07205 [Geodermatophilus sp. LHW52908]
MAGDHAGHADLQPEGVRVDPDALRADDLTGCEVGAQEPLSACMNLTVSGLAASPRRRAGPYDQIHRFVRMD